MTDLYCDEDALIDFLISSEDSPQKDAMAEHLLSCTSCQQTAASYEKFSKSLSNPLVWEREDYSSMLSRSDQSRLQELLKYSQKLEREREEAGPMIEKILKVDSEGRKEFVNLSSDFWTAGVARELSDRAHATVETQPLIALQLAVLSVQISEKLSLSDYQAGTIYQLRGTAWKEYAQALRFLGRYLEALQALDTAESTFSRATISEFDLAVVAYVRATILRKLDRFSEALVLAQKAARIFAQFGHQKRLQHARLLEATIYFNTGELRSARDIWLELIPAVKAESDVETLGHLLNNVGWCLVELGDYHGASSYLPQAISIFTDLGRKPLALSAQWGLGRLMISTQRYGDGIAKLHEVREEFEALQMHADAGVVALDIVEALLTNGRPDEGAVICRYLVERFQSCGMSTNAITAVSYLREALAAGKANPTLAKHVRNFVAEAPQHQELLFLPPPL